MLFIFLSWVVYDHIVLQATDNIKCDRFVLLLWKYLTPWMRHDKEYVCRVPKETKKIASSQEQSIRGIASQNPVLTSSLESVNNEVGKWKVKN